MKPVSTESTSDGCWRIEKLRSLHLRPIPHGTARRHAGGFVLSAGTKLEDIGETDHTAVLIDGTKLESYAGRYTFVWRKSVEKQLAKVKEEILREKGLTSPLDLQAHLDDLAAGSSFGHGSGRRKSSEQRVWEKLYTLLERWQKYEGQMSTMGEGRNSYSKTYEDATSMRLEEDHMRNGRL